MPYFHHEVCMIYHRKYKKKQEEKVSVSKTLHLIYGVENGLQKEETKKEITTTQHHNHQKNKNKQGRR